MSSASHEEPIRCPDPGAGAGRRRSGGGLELQRAALPEQRLGAPTDQDAEAPLPVAGVVQLERQAGQHARDVAVLERFAQAHALR